MSELRTLCANKPTSWPDHLDFALFAYRTSPLESLGGLSPFELMFGRAHNSFAFDYSATPPADSARPLSIIERTSELKAKVEQLHPRALEIQAGLKEAQAAQQSKRQATMESPLPVGTIVYALQGRMKPKLQGPDFVGPFRVCKRNKGGNYMLQSPSGQPASRAFPLDHLRVVQEPAGANIWRQYTVDRLRPEEVIHRIDRIIDHREHPAGGSEYLVQWEGFSPEFNSWELDINILSPDVISEYWGTAKSFPDVPFITPVMFVGPALAELVEKANETFKERPSSA
jgi:hypothetical protein